MEEKEFEQRKSKKFKNRAAKKAKNYGVQVPPSSWIRSDSDTTTDRVLITLTKNGDYSVKKAWVVTPKDTENWVDFIQKAGNKVKMKQAKTLYHSNTGIEIKSPEELQQDEVVVVSKGEEFIQISKPEDQIAVRGTIADLSFTFIPMQVPGADVNGSFALFHRPKRQHLNVLEENGCTHLFTLLSRKENGESLGKHIKRRKDATCGFTWLPLAGANPPPKKQMDIIEEKFIEIAEVLSKGGHVVIHCSAGLHRTGMMTNALLQWLGYSAEDALELIRQARPITARDCGAHRLAWAADFLAEKGTYKEKMGIQ